MKLFNLNKKEIKKSIGIDTTKDKSHGNLLRQVQKKNSVFGYKT